MDHNGAEAAFETLRPKLPEKERGQPADEWLFNVFATAALRAAADGGAWRRDAYLLYTYSILTLLLLWCLRALAILTVGTRGLYVL